MLIKLSPALNGAMGQSYLVRYGLMGRVGLFAADSAAYERGQRVVIRSARGVELGEVLLRLAEGAERFPALESAACVLRTALAGDLERARQLERQRPERLSACARVFSDGAWPLELIDVEPLLEGRRTVVHYLGPHRLDAAGLVEAIERSCGLEVWLEPAGRDAPDDALEADQERPVCPDCGAAGGGCWSAGSDGAGEHAGGCAGCAVKDLMRARR